MPSEQVATGSWSRRVFKRFRSATELLGRIKTRSWTTGKKAEKTGPTTSRMSCFTSCLRCRKLSPKSVVPGGVLEADLEHARTKEPDRDIPNIVAPALAHSPHVWEPNTEKGPRRFVDHETESLGSFSPEDLSYEEIMREVP
mmetsp:Transcript_51650/g.116243  ORF Transcript_51650/g.116243 Transcript_51650/m.116243 type:complete len:142 (+) Transcript_51650:89-514(+)